MTIRYIECKWKQIKRSVVTAKDNTIIRVYDDGMVASVDGVPFAQVKGWPETNVELLEKLSKATKCPVQESEEIELEEEPDFDDIIEDGKAKEELDSLPTFDPEKEEPKDKKKKEEGDSWTLNDDGNWNED